MNIRMLETRRLSEDGHGGGVYNKGETYYGVADTAARRAINNGWAVEVPHMSEFDVMAQVNQQIISMFANSTVNTAGFGGDVTEAKE